MQQKFAQNKIQKKYWAIVRGYTDDAGIIEYPLKNERGKVQDAITEYKTLNRSEIDIAFGKFKTSRYSLVEIFPKTGRYHQIRKHFAHIMHPIIGDRPHGCNKQNKMFKERFEMTTMMLHAEELSFIHPYNEVVIKINAGLQDEFNRTKDLLRL
jgi:tRNA pseudouridine65 synthase